MMTAIRNSFTTFWEDGGLCRKIESLAKRDDGLSRSDRCLSREVEGRVGRNGGQDLEANPEAAEVVVERQEVRNEEAVVDTVGALEDRYEDGNLVVWRSLQVKKRAQGISGYRKNLASTRRRVVPRAVLHCASPGNFNAADAREEKIGGPGMQ
jgi:hypothetical protein